MVDQRLEVESGGLSDSARSVDLADVRGSGGQKVGGAAVLGQLEEDSQDDEGAIIRLVHHVHLKREVLLVDAVLRGGVKVVLGQVEGLATDGGGAIDDGLESAAKVLKLGSLNTGEVDNRGLGGQSDSIV